MFELCWKADTFNDLYWLYQSLCLQFKNKTITIYYYGDEGQL